MKTAGFLSFSIDNILKDPTSESVFTGELMGSTQRSPDKQDRGDTFSPPACTSSPIHTSSGESTGADDSSDENSEPKRKKLRTTFCADQVRYLEDFYYKQQYLPATQRKKMASKLGLSDQQIKTWFQNRRMKEKRLQRESRHTMNCLAPEVCFRSIAPQIHPSPLTLHNHIASSRPYQTSDVINSSTSPPHLQPIDFAGKTSPANTLMSHPTTTYPLCINIPSPHAVSTSPGNQTGLLACQTSTSVPFTGFQHAVRLPGVRRVSEALEPLQYRQQNTFPPTPRMVVYGTL